MVEGRHVEVTVGLLLGDGREGTVAGCMVVVVGVGPGGRDSD